MAIFSGTGTNAQEIDDIGMYIEQVQPFRRIIPEPDTVTISFIGDVMLHTRQIEDAHMRYLSGHGCTPAAGDHKQYDFSPYFREIAKYLSEADLSVANMEFTLAGPPFTGYPSFSAPDSYAGYMAECGIDIFLTANNHILDKGAEGASRTLDIYRGMPIMTAGSAASVKEEESHSPLYVRIKGLKIAFVNFTYGTNRITAEEYPHICMADKEELERSLRKASEDKADFIIVLPHWGTEYSLKHSAWQEELARWLADNGADMVIGTHPHVVQDFEVIDTGKKKVPVIYSLGNAVSNMSAPYTQIGLMVTIRIATGQDGAEMLHPSFRYLWCSLPGKFEEGYCTIPVKEYIGKREMWISPYEYDKMINTYYKVKKATGIEE